MIDRDRALERDTLERTERVADVRGFADRVQARMDEVEASGGPDTPARTAGAAFIGAHEELVDAPSWSIVGLVLLREEVRLGQVDEHAAYEAEMLVEEAMAAAARAEHLMRGAVALLGGP